MGTLMNQPVLVFHRISVRILGISLVQSGILMHMRLFRMSRLIKFETTDPCLIFFQNLMLLVVIAGMSVPGRYLSGFPVSPYELVSLLRDVSKPVKLLCGPAARYGFGMSGGKHVTETSVVKMFLISLSMAMVKSLSRIIKK